MGCCIQASTGIARLSVRAARSRARRRAASSGPCAGRAARRAARAARAPLNGSPGVERGRDLLGDRARHPADLLAAGVHGDRVRVVRVVRVAAQLERPARLGRVGGERLARGGAPAPATPAIRRPGGGELRAPRGRGSGRRARRAGSPRARRSRRRPGTSSAPRARPRRSSRQRMRDLSGEHLAALAATVALCVAARRRARAAAARRSPGPRGWSLGRGDPRRASPASSSPTRSAASGARA